MDRPKVCTENVKHCQSFCGGLRLRQNGGMGSHTQPQLNKKQQYERVVTISRQDQKNLQLPTKSQQTCGKLARKNINEE